MFKHYSRPSRKKSARLPATPPSPEIRQILSVIPPSPRGNDASPPSPQTSCLHDSPLQNNLGADQLEKIAMAKDTGKGSQKGSVKNRTQVKNPKTSDYAKRNETKGSSQRGEFMDNKKAANPSKASPKSRTSGGANKRFRVANSPEAAVSRTVRRKSWSSRETLGKVNSFAMPSVKLCAVEHLAEILTRNLQRVEDLIKHVLDTKAEPWEIGSSFWLELRRFELWPLVQRLILDLRSVSSKNSIEVVNEIPPALTICADAGLISQVFQNLLGNAFKYAPQGQVVVSARDDDGTVTCVVRDNGAGIPLEMLAKVFDKLATDPDKTGTGLGLAIVKQIVEAHGGTVRAESTYGAGATFTFTIPGPAES